MSIKSASSKNILESKISKRKIKSNLFNIENKNIFIKNNKNALKYYQEFLKMQKNKSRNNKLSLDILNLNNHSKIEKFNENPIQILISYDKILFDEKKRKFKSQTLGVDEGLISLPKNYAIKSPLKFDNNNNLDIKAKLQTELKENIMPFMSNFKSKKNIKVTEMDRGEEHIHWKNKKYLRIKSEDNYDMDKLKKKFDNEFNYNFELKELDNWDYLNAQTLKESNKNLLILNKDNFRKRKSLINFNEPNKDDEEYKYLGFLLKMENDKNKLKIINRIKRLKDFFTEFRKEQDVLLLHIIKKLSKNYNLHSFFNSEIMKEEEKKEEKKSIGNTNYYKEIIKIKKRNEKKLHKELNQLAEMISLAKKDKEKYENKAIELNDYLKVLNEKESNIINSIRDKNISKDKTHTKLDLNLNLDDNDKENERRLMRTLSQKLHNFNTNNNDNINNNNIFDLKNEKRLLKRNYFLARRRKNTLIYNNLSKIRKKRLALLEDIKNNDIIIKEKHNKFKQVKSKFNEKVKFLKEYYYQILKKGIDVRKDGLSWIIEKLIELKAFIDKNHFPSFLSLSEIKYLLKVGIKKYELNELIKLFQLLKNHQKKIKEAYIQEEKEKKNKLREEKFNKLVETHQGDKFNIGNDYAEYLDEIYHKYENDINIYLNEKAEENAIRNISQKINKYVLTLTDDAINNKNDNDDNLYEQFYIPGSLSQYFEKDKEFRQNFDDIYYLNQEITKRINILKDMKDNEFKKYKDFIKNNSNKDNEANYREISERSKAFLALFGNNISI